MFPFRHLFQFNLGVDLKFKSLLLSFFLTNLSFAGTITASVSPVTLSGYQYFIFTSTGALTVTGGNSTVDFYLVAGGAQGMAGGGGAGGVTQVLGMSLSAAGYPVTVGAGGTSGNTNTSPATNGTNGNQSSFNAVTATGGGGGGGVNNTGHVGSNGASGGGGGSDGSVTQAGGTGISGQGNAGGGNGNFRNVFPSGGGGGSGTVGQTSPDSSTSGNGGAGVTLAAGWPQSIVGGGGGGCNFSGVNAGGVGATHTPGSGGSGLVIVRSLIPINTGMIIKPAFFFQ